MAGNLNKTGKYTNMKSISVKKKSVTLKVGKKAKIKAKYKLVKPNKRGMTEGHAKLYRYATTDSAVATVNKAGKITAKGKGTCMIYVIGINGVSRGVEVTVN